LLCTEFGESMYFIYLLAIVLAAIYFARRSVDVFTFAFLSSAIYFSPALLPTYRIEDGAYYIYLCVLALLVSMAHIQRQVFGNSPLVGKAVDAAEARYFLRGALVIYVPVALYWAADFVGTTVRSKVDVSGGVLHYAAVVLLGYVFASALVLRRWWLALVGALHYLLLVISGDRTQLVISIVAVLILYSSFQTYTLARLVRRIRLAFVSLAIAAVSVGIFGKDIYGAYFDSLAGESFVDALGSRLNATISNPSERFEPYHVQKVLNFAIGYDDRIDSSYLDSLPVQLMPMAGEIGGDVHVQSEIVKSLYFSTWSEDAGVSSNFFAEGFLLFGYVGAVVFSAIYVFGVSVFSWLMTRGRVGHRVLASFGSAFWVFYIHRSSLFQIVGHEKRIFYSGVAVLVAAFLVRELIKLGHKNRYG